MAWAGKRSSSCNFPAPKCWDTMAEMALLLWAKPQTNIEMNDPTTPTAAKDSVPTTGMFPTMAASVLESTGSAMPERMAGKANCCIRLKEMSVFCMESSKLGNCARWKEMENA